MPLDITDRALRLYSNRGDTIYSPFMGIGSEGWASLHAERRFIRDGIEGFLFRSGGQEPSRIEERTSGGGLFEGIESAA